MACSPSQPEVGSTILPQALAIAPGASGTATITGIGSTWINIGQLVVGNSGSGTLTIEAGGQVSSGFGSLGEVGNSTGTATVTGAGSKWTNSSVLYVGRTGSGTLTVSDGGEVVTGTLFASLDSLLGNGLITVTEGAVLDANLAFDVAHRNQFGISFGSGGMLTIQSAGGDLGAGYKHSGSLSITEGVDISSSNGYLGYRIGSTATATVTGANSQWINTDSLYVGRDGNGTLTIEAGGQVSCSIGYLGRYSPYSTGVATVTGAGSKWTNIGLYVGDGGNGTLTVEAGGQVSNITGTLGNGIRSTGSATITGPGSQWINSGELTVGRSGNATLIIEAGGLVSNTNAFLGYSNFSTGTATVTGTGSQWISSGEFVVGREGRGSLTIEAGGLVSVGGTFRIDFDSNGDSFINMSTGGMLALYGDAGDSLSQFLGLVEGTDAIRYWDDSLSDWTALDLGHLRRRLHAASISPRAILLATPC